MTAKLYFSDKCPQTPAFVDQLKARRIDYQAVNITDSMANLKEFLRHRDHRPEFKAVIEQGLAGVPVLYDQDQFIFDLDEIEA